MGRTACAILAAVALLAAGLSCVGPTAVGQTAAATEPGEKILGDFEDGMQGWEAANEAKISIVEEHATRGAKSLKAELPVGPYPGVGLEFKKAQDWSEFHALRLSVFNASKGTVAMSVRVDDAASKGFGTRYNGDMYPYKLNPGANDVEVMMAALKEGGFMCRGLDVSKIKLVRFFAGNPKQPVTLYFDNIRLVSEKPAGPQAMVLLGKGASEKLCATACDGTVVSTKGPDAATPDGPETTLQFPPDGGQYPRIVIGGVMNVLTYNLLTMTIACPKDTPSPASVAVKFTDTSGRSQTCTVPLEKGLNEIAMPLEIFAEVGLGKVKEVTVFRGTPQVKEEMTIRRMAIERVNVAEAPSVHDDKADDAAVTLDMTALKVPRNTCYMAMVYIPLADGKTRVVRCNSAWEKTERGATKYAIPAAAMEGCDRDKPVRAWVFVSDHGVWSYWVKSDKYGGKPITLTFVGGKE